MEDRAILMAVYAEERAMARHFDSVRTGVASVIVTGMGAGSATIFSTPDSTLRLVFAAALLVFGIMMTAIFGLNQRLYFQRLKMGKKMLRHAVDRTGPENGEPFNYEWVNKIRLSAASQSDDESERAKYRSLWWIMTVLVGVALPSALFSKMLVDFIVENSG